MTIKLQEIAKNVGFTTELAKSEKRQEWIVDTFNGIKMELEHHGNHWEFIACYYQPELADALRINFPQIDKRRGARAKFATPEELEAFVLEVLAFVEENEIEGDWAPGRKARKTENAGFFEKTAAAIKQLVDIEAWDFLNGRLAAFDDHDDIITIGKDKAVLADPKAPQWREHIVPCTLIKEEAIRMAQAGATTPQIAQMLKENLAIVIITAEEAKTLDAVYQTTMPAGWNFGDNIFARLEAMNIAY